MRSSDWSSDVCSSDLHRSHAYQRFSRYLGGARPVASAAFAFNLLALLPLSLALSENDGLPAYGVVTVVYVLLAVFAVATGAGLKDRSEERRVGKGCVRTGRLRGSGCH